MRTIEIKLYTFAELTPEAQAVARSHFQDINVDDDWWETTIGAIAEAGMMLGIEILRDRRGYAFWFDDRGASMQGNYINEPGAAAAVRKEWPKEEALHAIADKLTALQERAGGKLEAIMMNGAWPDVGASVYLGNSVVYPDDDAEGLTDSFRDALMGFVRWGHRLLMREHEYLTSGEAIEEAIDRNEIEFRASGAPWRG